jgi:hypothetical protein
MSRISALAGNGILRYGKTSKTHGCSLQREESLYHRDTMLRSGPSAHFLEAPDTWIPSRSRGSSGFHLSLGREGVLDRSAKRGGFQRMPSFPLEGTRLSGRPARAVFSGPSELCGNDMIDAHVENLVDSTLPTGFPQSLGKVFAFVYDFPTIIWITASQFPTFPQRLRALILSMLRRIGDFESSFVDLKLPL